MSLYELRYESDQIVGKSNQHIACRTLSLKCAKKAIPAFRKDYAKYNPRNFEILDISKGMTTVIYHED